MGHWFYKQHQKSSSCLINPDPTLGEGKVVNYCARSLKSGRGMKQGLKQDVCNFRVHVRKTLLIEEFKCWQLRDGLNMQSLGWSNCWEVLITKKSSVQHRRVGKENTPFTERPLGDFAQAHFTRISQSVSTTIPVRQEWLSLFYWGGSRK